METEAFSNKYQRESWMKDQLCEEKCKKILIQNIHQQRHPFIILIDALLK